MFDTTNSEETIYLTRNDSENLLSSYYLNAFQLDDATWPSVEHYYQGMKFEDATIKAAILECEDGAAAAKLAETNKRKIRKDWKKIKRTIMTRGLYIMFRTHETATKALLATDKAKLVEQSQYDYYWGCGRDLRGDNVYGTILMEIREKLQQELRQGDA